MKTLFKKTIPILIFAGALTVSGRTAQADGAADGHADTFDLFFGTATAASEQKRCGEPDGDDDGHAGMLGLFNRIMCHLEQDLGLKANGTYTKTFGEVTVHAVISDGTAPYAHQAQIWVCRAEGGTDCTKTTSFNRLLDAQWTFSADNTVNKATILMDASAYHEGHSGSGLALTYDIGTNTATQTLTGKAVRKVGGTNTFNLRVDATKVTATGVVKATIVRGNQTGSTDQYRRMDVAVDLTHRLELAEFERTGVSGCEHGRTTVDPTASSDTPTCTACYSRSADPDAGTGDDDLTLDTTGASCSALSLMSYPSDSAGAVGQYTTADDATHGILGSGTGYWNGMAANPSSL